MNKAPIISILVIFLIVLGLFVSATDNGLDMTVTNPSSGVNPGQTTSGSFTLTNNRAFAVNGITFTSTDLTSGSHTISNSFVSFSPISISSLNNGQTSSAINVNVNVPSNQAPGTYNAELSAGDDMGNNTSGNLFTVVVNSVGNFGITPNPLVVSTQQDDDKNAYFTITNNGNVDLSNIVFSYDANKFEDKGGDAITLEFDSSTTIGTINAGSNKEIRVIVRSDKKIDSDTYRGTITASANGGVYTNTFDIEVKIKPDKVVCKDGIIGDLDITDINFDEDDFKPGQTFPVDVDVENNYDDNLDVTVELYLYDVTTDDIIVDTEDTIDINDGDEETFNLELDIPITDLADSDEYILYVKAYEDGNEDENCAEDSDTVNLDLEKYDVVIDNFDISPDSAMCGELINADLDVFNVGSKDESDVYVELRNNELKISEKSSKFDLDKLGDKDSDAAISLSFTVPTDATEKSYDIEAIVYYNNGAKKRSSFATLNVAQCGPETSQGALNLLQTSFNVRQGSTINVPVTISNDGDSSAAFLVEVNPSGTWASKATKLVTVAAGQQSTVHVELQVSNTAGTGDQSAEVVLSSDGNELGSDLITVNIESNGVTSGNTGGGSITGGATGTNLSSKDVFWIIGDILLVIVAILFVKMIFFNKKD